MHTLINEIPTDYITSIDSLMVLPSISRLPQRTRLDSKDDVASNTVNFLIRCDLSFSSVTVFVWTQPKYI